MANAQAGLQFNEHIEGDGDQVFAHACKLALEGIVSKDRTRPYRSGPSKTWLKIKNPQGAGSASVRGSR
jgi:bifunctional non-homologous end joining protein LigD